ncbi:unnamed protein product, partial [Rotaria magnacalcarata]
MRSLKSENIDEMKLFCYGGFFMNGTRKSNSFVWVKAGHEKTELWACCVSGDMIWVS